MEKQFYAYTRVSTAKQGERGVSLQEQRDAIERYAQRYGLRVSEWFEERESAAKRGRPVFTKMLKLIEHHKAHGVIIHKIDRSARNLKDWADLGEMIDAGIEVHFANESLDLHTRGGRLSADIQAVVAADYIRNLREETKKGFYGRLKQGLFPIAAPVGYLDCGKGRKEPDPAMAPLVCRAFELYGTGKYSLHRLLTELQAQGLRNRRGGLISLNGLSTILNNPFYMGLMRIGTTGELFPGRHQPLVSKYVFDRVNRILKGKTVDRFVRHDFTFRKILRCATCEYAALGEIQKNHIYYRCHTTTCPTTSVREEVVEGAVFELLNQLRFDEAELSYLSAWMRDAQLNESTSRDQELTTCRIRLQAVKDRLARLTDAMVDGVLEKSVYDDRKNALLLEERGVKDRILSIERDGSTSLIRLEKFLELIKTASNLYRLALPSEKRDLLRQLASNLAVSGKNVSIRPTLFVELVANREKTSDGRQSQGAHRTWSKLLPTLLNIFKDQHYSTTELHNFPQAA